VRTSYEPGTFCWTDLGTTDAAGAKAFYGRLFGWEAQDLPAGDAGTYTMLRLDGHDVCALYERGPEQGPPAWLSYVSVEDAGDATERARRSGATVVSDPFAVVDAGRMAVIQDPTGALLALWEAGGQIGAGVVNDPGALCLNQLNTSDPEVAQRFYADLFAWRFESLGTGDQPYWGIHNGEKLIGGILPLSTSGVPSHWIVYFTTSDLDDSVRHIDELGGRVLVPPMPVGAGRIAVAQDPQGAAFALFEGRVDP